jgi:hypothetical protein
MKYLVLLIAALLSMNVFAGRFEKVGEVLEIVTAENSSDESNSNLAVFSIKGFTSAGECYVSQSAGHVLIRLRDNDHGKLQASILLAAYMSGKRIQARVDDSKRDAANNICYVEQIRIHESY